jgi:hypothetical protein
MPKRERVLPRELTQPHEDRLAFDDPNRSEILMRHELAMALDKPGYTDPATGYFVFTAKALAEEGKCCAMACRHCPFKR